MGNDAQGVRRVCYTRQRTVGEPEADARTRRNVGAAVVVALLALIGLSLRRPGSEPEGRRNDAPRAASTRAVDFVPPGSRAVAAVELEGLRRTPGLRRAVDGLLSGGSECERALVERVRAMVVVSPSWPPSDVGIAVEGAISVDAVRACAESRRSGAARSERYRDVEVLRIAAAPDGGAGSGSTVVALPGVVLIGASDVVDAMLDASIAAVERRGRPWALAAVWEGLARDRPVRAAVAVNGAGDDPLTRSLRTVGLTLEPTDDDAMTLEATGTVDSSAVAGAAAATLGAEVATDGGLSVMASAGDRGALARGVTVRSEGTRVTVRAVLRPARIVEALSALRRGEGR